MKSGSLNEVKSHIIIAKGHMNETINSNPSMESAPRLDGEPEDE
jgi:hypothetical protein